MGKVSKAVEKAAEEAQRPETDNTIRLRNGLVLRIKTVPPYVVRSAIKRLEQPRPPKIRHDDKGGVEEENPDDPQFKAAAEEYEWLQMETVADLSLAIGTEIEYLPEGMPGPESDDWINEEVAEFTGFEMQLDGRYGRYLSWLKFFAIGSLAELNEVTTAVRSLMGISEEEVSDAVESFRGQTLGRTDNGVSPEGGGDGNNVPANRAGRRTRNRRKGSG